MLVGQFPLARHTALPAGKACNPFTGAVPARMAALLVVAMLAGCAGSGTRAPVVDLSAAPQAPAATPSNDGTYIVKPGDSLYQIARATGTDMAALARWNNLPDPSQLRVGQVLRLTPPPGGQAAFGTGAQAVPVPAAKPAPADGAATEPASSQSAESKPAEPAAPQPPAPAPAPVATPPRAADASVITWAWPASGQIIQPFSARSKGIDIAGNPGDPVYAAADGMVTYSGNGVRGLGNLVIINHQNGFITAYAHNRTLLVQPGQEIKRGTKIAEIGQTDTTSPRLHFEIRRKGTPVDPLQYLPPR